MSAVPQKKPKPKVVFRKLRPKAESKNQDTSERRRDWKTATPMRRKSIKKEERTLNLAALLPGQLQTESRKSNAARTRSKLYERK